MRILVIEDYAPLRQALDKGLTQAGFCVDAVADGEQGFERAATQPYAVIVLDLMLPGIDGLLVLRQLRAARNHTHVLILTAKDAVEDRVAGLDAGADDYLTKPFVFQELLARVRVLVRRRFQTKDPAICIGDLHIDTAAKRVLRAGSAVTLSAREYALLEYFALRAAPRRLARRDQRRAVRFRRRRDQQRHRRLRHLPAPEAGGRRPATAAAHPPRPGLSTGGAGMNPLLAAAGGAVAGAGLMFLVWRRCRQRSRAWQATITARLAGDD